MKTFLILTRLVVGGVFIYAGALKLLDPQGFADAIAGFEMLPPQLVTLAALGLPPLEVLAGVLLIAGWGLRMAAFCILGLTLVFAVALGQALTRGLLVDCGCFGGGDASVASMWVTLGRDVLLMAGAGLIYWDAGPWRQRTHTDPR